MKKISTLFKKDPNDLGRVINEINPENSWVFTDDEVLPTRKYDGTACAIIDGQLYKRYDVKKGKTVPEFAIPCQEPDAITGHWHWILCSWDNPGDKYHMEGFQNLLSQMQMFPGEFKANSLDGTYELCGEKVQGNPEKIEGHKLIRHGSFVIEDLTRPMTFENLKGYLTYADIEGIVFHHIDGRMCKLRKSDYGIKR